MQIRIKNGMTRLFFAALGIFLLSSAAVVDASTVQYRYDELDRLYQAEYSDGTVVEYIYDNVDNRIAMSRVGMALTFSAYPPSPQGTGVQVTFTALVTGGTGPYEYEFQARFPGGTFGTVRNYSTDNTWTWNTTGSSGGGYEIRVNVRNAGSTAPFEARTTIADIGDLDGVRQRRVGGVRIPVLDVEQRHRSRDHGEGLHGSGQQLHLGHHRAAPRDVLRDGVGSECRLHGGLGSLRVVGTL